MTNSYDVGDSVRLIAVFRDENGESSAPDTVALYVRPPNGTVINYTTEVVREAPAGTYSLIIVVDAPGYWHYYWKSTGKPTTAEGGVFFVRTPAFRVEEGKS